MPNRTQLLLHNPNPSPVFPCYATLPSCPWSTGQCPLPPPNLSSRVVWYSTTDEGPDSLFFCFQCLAWILQGQAPVVQHLTSGHIASPAPKEEQDTTSCSADAHGQDNLAPEESIFFSLIFSKVHTKLNSKLWFAFSLMHAREITKFLADVGGQALTSFPI